MKKTTVLLLMVVALLAVMVSTASAVGGAAFTTYNPSVDGDTKDICKNSIINCNIYGAKEYVWLNGGPDANHLKPDGYYFFAVLEPGGQPNPNDQGGVPDKNLSDDYDLYTNRVFQTDGGEVSAYDGDHWLDSGEYCKPTKGPNNCKPDGMIPFIRLFPYSDTTNPGGVYIMAICYLGEDDDFSEEYPVDPRDCKYDAFKVKKGKVTYDFMLEGHKYEDPNADGDLSDGVGLPYWEITITGTGFDGSPINATVETSDVDGQVGYWFYQSPLYTFNGKEEAVPAQVTICEVLKDDWYQSFPEPSCYYREIEPSGTTLISGLDFGNYRYATKSGYKFHDLNANGVEDDGEPWLPDWTIDLFGTAGNGDAISETTTTDENGEYSFSVPPGSYTVCEVLKDDWYQSYPSGEADCSSYDASYGAEGYAITLLSGEEETGNKFGNWTPGEVHGKKWKDRDWDGEKDEGEPGLPDVEIKLYSVAPDDSMTLVATTYTCGGTMVPDCGEYDLGSFWFTDLTPGWYYVEEIVPEWYEATTDTSYGPFFVQSGESVELGWVFGNAPNEGCTPGYWKQDQHFDSWIPTGYHTDDPLVGLFSEVGNDPYFSHIATQENDPDVQMGLATLVQALKFGGGDTVADKAEILLRAAVAAVLNAAHPDVHYVYDASEVNLIVSLVNDALASQNIDQILGLAGDLDRANNANYVPDHCPLN